MKPVRTDFACFPYVVDAAFLKEHRQAVVLVDVRWYLDGRSGEASYQAGHLPGAVFLDIDRDLSGPPGPGGRHPLPDLEVLRTALQQAGIGTDDGVIAYDDSGGLSAARLVFLLRALGIRAAILDGGIASYDGPLESSVSIPSPTTLAFTGFAGEMMIDIDSLERRITQGCILLDVRTEERYRGVREPIDPVAGHIPGARNLPTMGLLKPSGHFLSPQGLRQQFSAVGIGPSDEVVVYCGSGVTACHTWLALQHSGHRKVRLYPGSWSEWCNSPGRPIATGDETSSTGKILTP
ncbi:MAG: sulfurtransferase [Myxococcota bacterium]